MRKIGLLIWFFLSPFLANSQQLEIDDLQYLDLSGDTIVHYLHQFIDVYDSAQGQPRDEWIIILRMNQILDAKVYEMELALHELWFMEGNYDEIENDFDSVAPPFFYSYEKDRLILIYTGLEHLSPSKERFYNTLELTDKYVPRFVPKEQEDEEWIQIIPPPTGGSSIWRVINCRGEIQVVRLHPYKLPNAQDDLICECKALEIIEFEEN